MAFLQWVAFIIYILAGILMTLAILLQEGKGGGLAGLGGAHAEATFGATNPLRRFTVVMAIIFLFLASFLSFTGRGAQMKIKEETPSQETSGEAVQQDKPGIEVSHTAAPEKEPPPDTPGEPAENTETPPPAPSETPPSTSTESSTHVPDKVEE